MWIVATMNHVLQSCKKIIRDTYTGEVVARYGCANLARIIIISSINCNSFRSLLFQLLLLLLLFTMSSSASSLLPAALQSSLVGIIRRANQSGASIRVILLSTTEGVPLGRAYAAPEHDATAQIWNEDVLSSIETVWAPASKQLPLLGLEKAQQVTAIYDHGTLLHVYQAPVVVTILCGPDCNVGAVKSCAIPSVKQVLEPLCNTLVESLKPVYEASTPAYYQ